VSESSSRARLRLRSWTRRPLIRGAVVAPLAVAIVAIALGVWRLMPGVGFWDTAEFQTVPPILGTAHPTGYPTYVILGWFASALLTPFGEAAFRMNLLSAILVGLAAGLTVDLVRRLIGSTVIATAAGLGLAATPVVWAIGTHADPHALHLLFVVAILWLLVRWDQVRLADPSHGDRWLVAAAAVTGLSAGNHSLTLLLGVPIGLYVLAVEPQILRRRGLVARSVAAFVVAGALVYLELPLRGGLIPELRAPLVYGSPSTIGGFVYVATGEQFRGGLNDPFGELPRKAGELVGLAVQQFGLLAPLLVLAFIVTASRFPAYALLTGSAMAITCFFDSAYVNADIGRYYLGPALFAWTWLAILAATVMELVVTGLSSTATMRRGAARRRLDRLSVVGLAFVVLLGPTLTALPERAVIVDRSTDRAAQAWLDDVLTELRPNAIVLSWWSFSTPLWYAQLIEGRRPDIAVIDDRTRLDEHLGELTDVIDANLATRPVYVLRFAASDLESLRLRYDLTPLASSLGMNVFRVSAPAAAARP
jgi:transmembrane protein TMEM260 (protein O-mannosyltransferase)